MRREVKLARCCSATDASSLQSFVHFDFSGTASLNWRDRRPITEVTDLMEGWDPTLVEAIKTFKSERSLG